MIENILFLSVIVLLLAVVVIIALYGMYAIGKQSGYWKRIEEENRRTSND